MTRLHLLKIGIGSCNAVSITHNGPVRQRLWLILQFFANEHGSASDLLLSFGPAHASPGEHQIQV
jgi:hypothetical protein